MLTLACAQRLIEDSEGLFYVYAHTGLTGNADIREKAKELARSATPYQLKLLITDLDSGSCPADLMANWLGPVPLPESMLFLVTVRAVESWVLADCKNFARIFEVPEIKIPGNPEKLDDPKDALLRLIHQHSKRPDKGEIVVVAHDREPGPRYNEVLSEFVEKVWSPAQAEEKAPSLARTILRIQEFAHKFAPLNSAAEAPRV